MAESARFDVAAVRATFPALEQCVGKRPLAYLDNAATTQKPRAVLDAILGYYEHDNANVHRAAHALADRATRAFEGARGTIARAIGASEPSEVIFTRGTTEALNLVAATWASSNIAAGDNLVTSIAEHHSNLVPWQQVALRQGAELRYVGLDAGGDLDLTQLEALIDRRTRLVAIGHVSNALGTVNPVADIAERVHAAGALLVVDGAQRPAHGRIDVRALGCDFYALSGHKMFGPTGIGALWGRRALLESMPPYQFGGEMIREVTEQGATWNELPYKFEAGTPNIAGAIGLGAAFEFLDSLERDLVAAHEAMLVDSMCERLAQLPRVRLIGQPRERAGVVSFLVDGAHPHDVGTLLDQQGVAVRTGHHCAMPLMQRLGIPGTVRASLALYNDEADVSRLIEGVEKALDLL